MGGNVIFASANRSNKKSGNNVQMFILQNPRDLGKLDDFQKKVQNVRNAKSTHIHTKLFFKM